MRKFVATVALLCSISTLKAENWDPALLIERLQGHTDAVQALAFSPNGQWLLSGSADKTVRVWDAKKWKWFKTFGEPFGTVKAAAFSPGRKIAATAGADTLIRLWNTENWKPLDVLKNHDEQIHALSFSPDGTLLASASADKTTLLWDTRVWKKEKKLKGHRDAVFAAQFSPDGRYLATTGRDGAVIIRDAVTWDEIRRVGGRTALYTMAFSDNGRMLAAGGLDKTVKIWDPSSGRLLTTFSGHEETVQAVVFSAGGRFAVSSGMDGQVKIWNPSTGEELRSFAVPNGAVQALALSPNGALAAGAEDGSLYVWRGLMVYINPPGALLTSSGGSTILSLPPRARVDVVRAEAGRLYVVTDRGIKGWVKDEEVAFARPKLENPALQVLALDATAQGFYLKGAVFSDEPVVQVSLNGQALERAAFKTDADDVKEVFAFEAVVSGKSGDALEMVARCASGAEERRTLPLP